MKQSKTTIPLLLFALLITGCTNQTKPIEAIRSVKCDTVQGYTPYREVSRFPGSVKAASEVKLSFRISGPIVALRVNEGEFVRKGTILAEMDARDYQTQLSATEAEYHRIKSEADRIMELYHKESIPQNDYDKARFGLQQVSAKLEAHRNAVADTRLVAPFDGYIQKRWMEAGESVSAGMPIVSLLSSETPEVEVKIPTNNFIKRDKFLSASCTIDGFDNQVFELELIGTTPKANLNQLYTTRFRLLGNSHPAPGMNAVVTLNYHEKESSLHKIAFSALNEGMVWVVEENRVSTKKVRVVEVTADGFAWVEGVQSGELVVTAGIHSLKSGMAVKPLQKKSTTNVGGVL